MRVLQEALIRLSPLQWLMEDMLCVCVCEVKLGHHFYQQGVITFSPFLFGSHLTFVS